MNSPLSNVILSKSFPLNVSRSKYVIIGVEKNPNRLEWIPTIHFVSQFWLRVSLTSKEWNEFKKIFNNLEIYFADKNYISDSIKISENCSILLSTAHNKKSIIIEKYCKYNI